MDTKSDKLLILDLDETLIHATEKKLTIKEDFKFDNYFIYKRPNLIFFLNEIAKHYTIGIWSSADHLYVEEIVKLIQPSNIEFKIIWGNNKCTLKRNYVLDEYVFEKRLSKLKKKGFKLEKMIIVDDTPEKVRNNYGNAIYIKPFMGNETDCELLHLIDYLIALKNVENIRTIEKRNWKRNE